MSYGKGLHLPDQAKLARRLHAMMHPALRTSVEPSYNVTLEPCARLNQKSKGYCHAYSGAGVSWTALNAAGTPLSWIPSPTMIASCTYADVQGPADKRGPLQDTGADLSDDATAMGTWGLAPIRPTSTDDGISDVDGQEDGLCPEPDASQIAVGGEDLVQGEYQIPVDTNAPVLIGQAFDAKIPIWFGGPVNALYEQLQPNDVATAACTTGGDGHAQYLNAIRKVNGAVQCRIQGSWGYTFADQGAVWCDVSYLLSQWMLWLGSFKLKAVAA